MDIQLMASLLILSKLIQKYMNVTTDWNKSNLGIKTLRKNGWQLSGYILGCPEYELFLFCNIVQKLVLVCKNECVKMSLPWHNIFYPRNEVELFGEQK